MSDALKRLDEIEERVKAATPGPWDYVLAHRVFVQQETGEVVTAAEEDVPPCVADAALIAHAPADLALLLKATRAYQEWGERVIAHCEAMNFNTREEKWIAEEFEEIRRELSGGVR